MESEISKFLRRDHNQLDDLFHEFQMVRATNDAVKTLEWFETFKSGLLRHMALEEDVLFCFYEERTGKYSTGTTAIMREEHDRLRNILDIIHKKIKKADLRTQQEEQELFLIMEDHSEREDNDLYMAIDIVTTEEEKMEIFLKMKNYSKSNACGIAP